MRHQTSTLHLVNKMKSHDDTDQLSLSAYVISRPLRWRA